MTETSMTKEQMNQLRNELRECFRRNAGHWGFNPNQYEGYALQTMSQRALFDGNGNPTPDA